jgi:iron complex outermembrane receptor protein
MNGHRSAALYLGASLVGVWAAVPAMAQTEPDPPAAVAGAGAGEIIVTARKRQESILKVPVVVTAISQERLDQLQTTEITDLPKLVPGLTLGQSILSIGTVVSIRGIGTTSQDAGVDQSVSLNIDGLSLGQGLAFSSGMFDLGQIEVLKGPQALFYGKSSPGGVISLRTADPTDELEILARAGYEFEGREGRGELIVSGPLTETLKARVAGMYARGKGYFRNIATPEPGTGAVAPYQREPRPRNYVARGTLLWDPHPDFSARFKVNLVRDRGVRTESGQLISCPEGAQTINILGRTASFMGGDDCELDRNLRAVYMDPAAFPGIPNNGVPYVDNLQRFGTLEMNLDLTPQLSISSTTAYYRLRGNSLTNSAQAAFTGPSIVHWNRLRRHDFTEELRLDSDFSGPLNFTAGAFFQDATISNRVINQGNVTLGQANNRANAQTTIDIKTYSLFGQLRWQVLPQLELAGGARWTDETRRERVFDYLLNVPRFPIRPRLHASNVAPEFTATYTPTDDLTLFGAYKQGFKSGSFTLATTVANGGDNAFDDERVRGYELGLKSRLLDRQLLLNVAFYDYRYKGLQVGATLPVPGAQPVIRTINAGSARTYGIDFDAAFRPAAVEGLSVNLAVNWNRGRYRTLNNLPCWGGQTVALGCDQILNPVTGRFTSQDLSGTPLGRAAEWQATLGFDYEMPIGRGMALALANSNQISSEFPAFLAVGRPNDDNMQPSFFKADVSLALRGRENRWEVALIGKNITNEITTSIRSVSNYGGGLLFGGQIQGGATSGPIGLSEALGYTERGRSIWLRLTLRPFG